MLGDADINHNDKLNSICYQLVTYGLKIFRLQMKIEL